jgi:hypothetical protein
MPKVEALLSRWLAWTSKPVAPRGYLNMDACNIHFAYGHEWHDRAYKILSKTGTTTNKPAALWTHRHTDSGQFVVMYHNTTLLGYPGAADLGTGLTAGWRRAFVNMSSPAGQSVFFNGTDVQARLIQEITSAANSRLFTSLVQPAIVTSFATSGGSIADGTYQCRVCWFDDDGAVVAYGEPSAADAIVVSGGGGSATITINEPADTPARATKFRVALTAAGAADTPANFLYYTDYAVTAGNQTWTALPTVSATQAFADINGTYRTAVPPISNIDVACLHDGRLFVGSTTGHEIAWSDRDNMNHWYADQVISSGAETSWNGPVLGLVSAHGQIYVVCPDSIHKVFGSFRRDDQGTNATFAIDVRTRLLEAGVGGVNHESIVKVGGDEASEVYFWSTLGPAKITPSGVVLVGVTDIEFFLANKLDPDYLDRIVGCEDRELKSINWAVPRRTNSSRPMDGASTAGIPDWVIRFSMLTKRFYCPLDHELVWMGQVPNPGSVGDVKPALLQAVGPHAAARLQLNYGKSGGGPDDVSGGDYDGKLSSDDQTTSVEIALAGITADDLIGKRIELYYPSTDTGFPSVRVRKTISDNTVTDGSGNVVLSWVGALTVPSGTNWTVRFCGWTCVKDSLVDVRDYLPDLPPGHSIEVQDVECRLHDVVGAEAVS